MIRHCVYCAKVIWPFQSSGWFVAAGGIIRWHGACRVQARVAALRELA